MNNIGSSLVKIGVGAFALTPVLVWYRYYQQGKQFALRDTLQKADAIVVLAGTRGNMSYLKGKIETAVELYKQGWAPYIICSGRFSEKVTDTPQLIPFKELQMAADCGRIQQKDVAPAATTWDEGIGANYMRDEAIRHGVPAQCILVDHDSLHTHENAQNVAGILEQNNMQSIILVTSPFHQLRTNLTFAKVLQPLGIKIINYYANTGEWERRTWFFDEEKRKLVQSELERITKYREIGHLI